MTENTTERLSAVFRRCLGLVPDSDQRSGQVQGWDSIAHINLVLAIEQEFQITFTPEEVAASDSFAALLELIAQKGEA